MTKTGQDIPTQAGDVYIGGDKLVINDSVVKDDGSDKDLTDASITFKLLDIPGGNIYIEKDNSGGDVNIIDGPQGELQVIVHGSETSGLGEPEGEDYYYEIQVVDKNGDPATVTTGTITIQSDS